MDKNNINYFNEDCSKSDILKASGVKVDQQPSTSAVKLEPLSPKLEISIKKEPIELPVATVNVEADTFKSSQQARENIHQNHAREQNTQSAHSSSNRVTKETIIVVIRGLLKTDTNLIKRELMDLGYDPLDIYLVKPRKTCSYVVTLKTMPNVSAIYKLKRLLSCHIQIQPWCASKDTVQCKKCLQFWHAANNCRRRRVCPRCGGEHKPQKCPRSLHELRCANCTGPHAATDVRCPIFKVEMQKAKQVAAKAKRYHAAETNPRNPVSQYQPPYNTRTVNYTAPTAFVPRSMTTVATREHCYGRIPHTHNSKVCYFMVLDILKSVMAALSSGQEATQEAIIMGLLKYDAWIRMSGSYE